MISETKFDALVRGLNRALWTKDPEIIAPYLVEWRDRWRGQTPLLLLPKSTNDVATIVKHCAKHKIALTIQGGNTGLVGGQIPNGEVLLSLKKLNAVRSISCTNRTMECEAGVTLKTAQDFADKNGLKFPLSLASEGSCTIGGNLATNAGGVHVIKYGTARALCLGVEAVLADGSIYHGLSSLQKDNTGPNLSQLFIGAEGTLGIITAASLKLFAKPQQISRALVAFENLHNALELLGQLQGDGRLSMFEVFPDFGMDLVTKYMNIARPFARNYPWYGVLEWEFSPHDAPEAYAPEAYMERQMALALEKEMICDGIPAQSNAHGENILALRENLSAAQKSLGAMIKHDISVPICKVPEFINVSDRALQAYMAGIRILAFGHIGDGNIHYNVAAPINFQGGNFLEHESKINQIVYDILDGMNGSISAEHGIGILKKNQLAKRGDPAKLTAIRALKTALDPDNILNPRVLL